MKPLRQHRPRESGFTMVELAILLTILSIIGATAMMNMVTGSSAQAQAVTMQRMQTIQEQLTKYYYVFFRVPCPALTDVPPTDTAFGTEGGDQGDCTHTTGILSGNGTAKVVLGSVPTKVLNLPDEYMFDGWGRRMDYIVDIRYTTVTQTPLSSETATGSTVNTDGLPDVAFKAAVAGLANAGPFTKTTPVALMSHGVSGNKAVPIFGTTIQGPDDRISTLPNDGNTDEKNNLATTTGYWIYRPFLPSAPTNPARFDMIVYPIPLSL